MFSIVLIVDVGGCYFESLRYFVLELNKKLNMALVCLADFEDAAFKKIHKNALDYYKSGAGNELTLALNRSSFDHIRIRPRLMRNVSKRDLSCNILGLKLSMPIGKVKI